MDVGRPKPYACDVCVCVREMSEDVEGEKEENERGRRKVLLATLLSGCAIQPLYPPISASWTFEIMYGCHDSSDFISNRQSATWPLTMCSLIFYSVTIVTDTDNLNAHTYFYMHLHTR